MIFRCSQIGTSMNILPGEHFRKVMHFPASIPQYRKPGLLLCFFIFHQHCPKTYQPFTRNNQSIWNGLIWWPTFSFDTNCINLMHFSKTGIVDKINQYVTGHDLRCEMWHYFLKYSVQNCDKYSELHFTERLQTAMTAFQKPEKSILDQALADRKCDTC